MDQPIPDPLTPEEADRLAKLQAEIGGLDLPDLIRALMRRFDLPAIRVAELAGVEPRALYGILNSEKRTLQPEHVDALLDELEAEGKLTQPAEKWIWHQELRVAAYLQGATYKQIEPVLQKMNDAVEKVSALEAFIRNLYPSLVKLHAETKGQLPALIPLAGIMARRLPQRWG